VQCLAANTVSKGKSGNVPVDPIVSAHHRYGYFSAGLHGDSGAEWDSQVLAMTQLHCCYTSSRTTVGTLGGILWGWTYRQLRRRRHSPQRATSLCPLDKIERDSRRTICALKPIETTTRLAEKKTGVCARLALAHSAYQNEIYGSTACVLNGPKSESTMGCHGLPTPARNTGEDQSL
jgi:hypothetical protein